ncbi:hypothetical protein [Conexibacter sp. CPCC 206217]|uniref:hypothetical protein n=1 Tax=Conexibacter sp. CPCC 206217 TaxID=3064574 RepID=UPI00272015A6|nr:hypothetical protein [Conexibacter sp. CPCC 206217]MDO8209247.1 hypothetical protein [Conexibacter sp. CPCC 206217]
MGSSHDDTRFDRPGSALGGDLAGHVEAIVRAAEREALAAERAIEDRRRSAEEEVRRYLAASRLHVDAEAAARAARLESLSSAARRLADELSDAAAALNDELRRSDDELRGALPRAPWPAAPAPPAAPAGAAPAPAQHAEPVDVPPVTAPTPPPVSAVAPPASDPAPERTGPMWARASEPVRERPIASDEAREPEPAPADQAPATNGDVSNAARLVAIEMAVGGAARADVERHLLERFTIGDATPLLDDVFGAESHAGSRLAWGEP